MTPSGQSGSSQWQGKHKQLFQVVLVAASWPLQALRNPKKASQITVVGSENGNLWWYPKMGDNEMEQTVGFHFVVPRCVEPNRFQKPDPFFKKNISHFFKKLFHFQDEL